MLRCAYLPDGVLGSVVLWGQAGDLRGLAALFLSLSTSPREERIGDGGSPGTVTVTVTVRFDDHPRGMRAAGNDLAWEMAPADAARFSELLIALAASPCPAHQYLDCASGEGLTVKASLGEYPDEFRP